MAPPTRSRRDKEAGKSILLPDVWVTHYVTSRNGRPLNLYYYINVRTRQKFYSKAAFYRHFRQVNENDNVKRERSGEEEKDEMCSRCKEIGHNCTTCPYPIIHKINPYAGAGHRIHRCGRCHCLGHNVRTCTRPLPQLFLFNKHLEN